MIHLLDIAYEPRIPRDSLETAFNMINEPSAEHDSLLFNFSVLSIIFIALSALIVFLVVRKKQSFQVLMQQ